ncbi:MAG: hypothetical protein ACKOC8_09795 [Pirellulales bacterium]
MTAAPPPGSIDVERDLSAANPNVLFAAPRTIRRLIRAERRLPPGWWRVPHADIAVLPAHRLREVADDILDVPTDLPETVAVVARPAAARAGLPCDDATLRDYWRLTFHALVDLAARQAFSGSQMPAVPLTPEQAAEARTVLVDEGLVPRDADDAAVLAEFVAVFLELRCFAPAAVAAWFPAIADPHDLAAALAEVVDAEALLERALPPALDPDAADRTVHDADEPLSVRAARGTWPSPPAAALRRHADQTAQRGNLVRAALDEWRAAAARPPHARPAPVRLRRQVEAFARRLGWALDLDQAGSDDAETLVAHLVDEARGSAWSPQARLLYDLQKICVDSERESFRTQLLRWAFSLGHKPLAIPLSCQRLVLIHRHAVAAAARLPAVRLPTPVLRAARRFMEIAVSTTASAARDTLRPRIEDAVHEAGLVPGSIVEEAARDTLTDELLDSILDRGFVSFGGVRDAISRNQLKLPDLAGVRAWMAGDELLRLDARLATTLDGAYRRAPTYLSVMQRVSAPFFGIPLGRLLTTHVLLPFGAAWIILRGLEHIVEPVTDYSFGETWHIYTQPRMLAIGVVLWTMIHLPAVRKAGRQVVQALVAAGHLVFVSLPARLLALPAVRRLLGSRPVRWLLRHVSSPLVVSTATWLLLPHHGGVVSRSTPGVFPAVFTAAAMLLNTRTGRLLQEQGIELVGAALHQLHAHVIVGLLSWIVDAFRTAMNLLEGALYAVDEMLRFRADESGLTLAVKAVAGAVWSVVEAFVRFCVTLLIEPQLNPIKHFPVVTVSHKLLVPLIPVVASQLVETTGMERGLALTAVTFVSTCIPGVFGFLAWELKENWRLYAANRAATLRPVRVGHHGETVRRLLMPGFHSGTIPKLFRRLRRLRPRGVEPAMPLPPGRADHDLHDLRHAVATFLDRHVLALVQRTAAGRRLGAHVEEVTLSLHRITATIASAHEPVPLMLAFERRDDTIESLVLDPGWIEAVSSDESASRLAVAGLHRLAGADRGTAGFVAMPAATPVPAPDAPSTATETVDPIAWMAWRDAWERQRTLGSDSSDQRDR